MCLGDGHWNVIMVCFISNTTPRRLKLSRSYKRRMLYYYGITLGMSGIWLLESNHCESHVYWRRPKHANIAANGWDHSTTDFDLSLKAWLEYDCWNQIIAKATCTEEGPSMLISLQTDEITRPSYWFCFDLSLKACENHDVHCSLNQSYKYSNYS